MLSKASGQGITAQNRMPLLRDVQVQGGGRLDVAYGDRNETDEHQHVGPVVAQAYAVRNPAAVLVEAQHRAAIEPMLMCSLWEGGAPVLPLSEGFLGHETRVRERGMEGGAYRGGVNEEEEDVHSRGTTKEVRNHEALEPGHTH
eukprot:CAMPEP_0206589188 /NCGR_PEP_ID=MMETSP0325_2-20121206/38761_1 /ASSEMBLY_ACC=CAM_ASM_000347 /TAXON_ID=2866 /ORGANISM="Crypthecodinium cohnii, Strain Seligo" /LENGTH=143 /DNA_ID=CAMNT_0054097673 /DNA_START=291 /DNA_END=723 /DNA_ORIENTATION=-